MTQPRSHSQGYKSTTHRTPNSMFVQRTGARVSVSPGRAGEKASQVDFGRQDSSGKAGDKQGQRVQKPARPLRPLRRALSTGRRQPASRPLLRGSYQQEIPCDPVRQGNARWVHTGREAPPRPALPAWRNKALRPGMCAQAKANLGAGSYLWPDYRRPGWITKAGGPAISYLLGSTSEF